MWQPDLTRKIFAVDVDLFSVFISVYTTGCFAELEQKVNYVEPDWNMSLYLDVVIFLSIYDYKVVSVWNSNEQVLCVIKTLLKQILMYIFARVSSPRSFSLVFSSLRNFISYLLFRLVETVSFSFSEEVIYARSYYFKHCHIIFYFSSLCYMNFKLILYEFAYYHTMCHIRDMNTWRVKWN